MAVPAGEALMTVEEFLQLPEDTGEVYHELRHGEVVAVTRPILKHTLVQRRLRRLLEAIAGSDELIECELPFKVTPEHTLRVADVAYVNRARLELQNVDTHLEGAPELVIEVLSPSNTAAALNDKEKLCLENGSQQFWVVDTDLKLIKVSTPDGHTITYRAGQQIPLPLFGDAALDVKAVFE